jgi:hypothetical protein
MRHRASSTRPSAGVDSQERGRPGPALSCAGPGTCGMLDEGAVARRRVSDRGDADGTEPR